MIQENLFEEPVGCWRVEVWSPVSNGWVPMDRIESGGRSDEGKWTFTRFDPAVKAAQEWVDAGTVRNPVARVFDVELDASAWNSAGIDGPVEHVNVSEAYL